MSVRGIAVGACTVALLSLGIVNVLYILAQSPVVNTGLRVADATGEWRMAGVGVLYERSAYLRERAVDFLVAAAQTDDADDALALARSARDAARSSVQAGPADASSWLILSWAELLMENDRAAREALMRSWALAPNSLALASDRLILAETLGLLAGAEVDAGVHSAVERDVSLLMSEDSRSFEALREMLPTIVARFDVTEQST